MKQSLGRKSILFLSQQLHSLTISDPAQYTVRLFILLRKKKKKWSYIITLQKYYFIDQ